MQLQAEPGILIVWWRWDLNPETPIIDLRPCPNFLQFQRICITAMCPNLARSHPSVPTDGPPDVVYRAVQLRDFGSMSLKSRSSCRPVHGLSSAFNTYRRGFASALVQHRAKASLVLLRQLDLAEVAEVAEGDERRVDDEVDAVTNALAVRRDLGSSRGFANQDRDRLRPIQRLSCAGCRNGWAPPAPSR